MTYLVICKRTDDSSWMVVHAGEFADTFKAFLEIISDDRPGHEPFPDVFDYDGIGNVRYVRKDGTEFRVGSEGEFSNRFGEMRNLS